ncbi:MAG: glycine cleavage system protein H [Syntrophobacteria bacterium]
MKEKSRTRFKVVPSTEEKCIWMEAGVIDYKLCNHYYDCHTCPFDKAMQQVADKNAEISRQGLEPSGKKAHIISWQEKMKKRPGVQRECRHTLTGRTSYRLCPYEFECHNCEFDQMLEDSWQLQIPSRLTNIPQVDGYGLPEGHFFHLGHAWARIEHGGRIRVGLDDFSVKVFGQMDSLELPLTGEEVKFSEVGLAFKRMGKEAQALSPISGVVAAVNYQTTKNPSMVKEEPYNQGWLMVLDPTEMKEDLKALLYGQESTEWLQTEHQALAEMVSSVGMTYADGGAIDDVVGRVPELSWEKLTQKFLRT